MTFVGNNWVLIQKGEAHFLFVNNKLMKTISLKEAEKWLPGNPGYLSLEMDLDSFLYNRGSAIPKPDDTDAVPNDDYRSLRNGETLKLSYGEGQQVPLYMRKRAELYEVGNFTVGLKIQIEDPSLWFVNNRMNPNLRFKGSSKLLCFDGSDSFNACLLVNGFSFQGPEINIW